MGFKDVAAKKAQGAKFFDLTEGKEKVDVSDLMIDYPDGILITGFCMTKNKETKDDVAVFTFDEDPGSFFFGGTVLTDLAHDWVEPYNGDYEEATKALQDEGGVRIKLVTKKSKTGRKYTAYEMI